MIGTLLNNRYRLEAELGRGGMGIVYRAHDTALEREVAIKVIRPDLEPVAQTRFVLEARLLARLNHPHIVAVYDVGQAEGSPYIVMELVEGASLDECPPREMDDIIAIGRQVCAALQHAHSLWMVHRDLKPENVLVSTDGTAKLGLARLVQSGLTSENVLMGTPRYLAPEIVRGEEPDGRSDLYALGVMLYELTTGQPPFSGDTLVALIAQHLKAPVVPPRDRNPAIPPALDALIVQLLSKQPADRPASAAEVLAVLERLGAAEAAAVAYPRVEAEPEPQQPAFQ
jgi:serine/threonine protein kinase